jgi:hypothetical protein
MSLIPEAIYATEFPTPWANYVMAGQSSGPITAVTNWDTWDNSFLAFRLALIYTHVLFRAEKEKQCENEYGRCY